MATNTGTPKPMAGHDDDEESLNTAASSLLNNKNESGKSGSAPSGGLVDIPCCGCLSVQFYQPYFDINSEDVKKRLMHSMFYCKREELFLATVGDKPDAYGPIWVSSIQYVPNISLGLFLPADN
jgi:hypothetical protein